MSETNNKGVKVLASASLLFVTIIWGSAFVVMKNSMDAITPTYLLAYRFTIAALGMAALFWKQIRGMSMLEFKCGALAGLFLFISYYFQTYGLKYTTASKNAFITTLYVVIVPFLAWAVNHVRPKANNLIAAGFAVVGLALLSLKGDLSVNFGDFLTLVCGICFAVHMIFLDRFTAYCTPIRLTVMQMGTAAACSWVLGLLTEGAFHPEVFTQFVEGYKGVFILMVIGYVLHFMPKSAENAVQGVVTRSPLLVQAVILAVMIFVVVQFKSAGVQPFIYFQF